MITSLGIDDPVTLAEAREMKPNKYLVYLVWVRPSGPHSLHVPHIIYSQKSYRSLRAVGVVTKSNRLGLLYDQRTRHMESPRTWSSR